MDKISKWNEHIPHSSIRVFGYAAIAVMAFYEKWWKFYINKNSFLFSVMVFSKKKILFASIESITTTKGKSSTKSMPKTEKIQIVYNSSDTVIMFYCYDYDCDGYWLELLKLCYQNAIQYGFAFPYETLTCWCYFSHLFFFFYFVCLFSVSSFFISSEMLDLFLCTTPSQWPDEHISSAHVHGWTFAHQNNHKQLQWMETIIILSLESFPLA